MCDVGDTSGSCVDLAEVDPEGKEELNEYYQKWSTTKLENVMSRLESATRPELDDETLKKWVVTNADDIESILIILKYLLIYNDFASLGSIWIDLIDVFCI